MKGRNGVIRILIVIVIDSGAVRSIHSITKNKNRDKDRDKDRDREKDREKRAMQ